MLCTDNADMKKRTILTTLFILLTPITLFAQNNTPDYYKCTNKKGGEWNFGRAPNICDAYHFIETDFVERNFVDAIFYDPVSRTEERKRYMTEMNAILKATADYFIRMRKPAATETEIAEFVEASLAVANQETYWSHYRQAVSGNTQFMRGDLGHGHGLMQIDDRWHFDAVTSGKGAHLIHNIMYSLDEYFAAWEKAVKQSCLNSPTNWVNRARSAYSAYNGGSSKICRWTNPRDTWARNDQGFLTKYNAKAWNNYIDDQNKMPSVDVQCLAEGGQDCRAGNTEPQFPVEGRYYKIASGLTCMLKDDVYHCVENNRDRACLVSELYAQGKSVKEEVYQTEDESFEVKIYDRHSICHKVTGLYKVGDKIKLGKNINLRDTPGGQLLTTTKSGSVYQIIDFEVFADPTIQRYYKLKQGNSTGWIYSGDQASFTSWSSLSQEAPSEKVFAEVGDTIETKREVSLFDINDNAVFSVAEQTKVIVQDIMVKGLNNLLFFKVTIDGTEGFLFGGPMVPALEIYDNLMLAQAEEPVPTPTPTPVTPEPVNPEPIESTYATVKGWYKSMRSCASTSCSRIKFIWGGNTVKVISDDGSWLLVEYSGKRGYLKKSEVSF